MQVRRERLSWRVRLCFAAPSFAGAAMAVPIAVHMPRFYADVVLAPLGAVAVAIALARSLDALTDPLIGWLSDRTRSRWGRRKPYIALGVPLCALAFVALFSPPRTLEGGDAGLWFGMLFALYFLFSTVFAIPHAALGAEVTLDYHERTSLFGIHSIFVAAGTICASILPAVLESGFGIADERRVFALMGRIYALLLIGLYAVLLLGVPERREFATRASTPFVPGVRRALRNRPFRILLLAGIVAAVPAAMPATLIPFFVHYVIVPEDPGTWLALYLLLYLGLGFVALPAWMRRARRVGRLRTLVECSLIGISGSLLFFLVPQGRPLWAAPIYAYVGLGSAAVGFLIPAMGSDTIDYDELRTGMRREAQFVSFWSIIPKFVAIPGSSIPIAVLAAVGYVPDQAQTPTVVLTLRILYALFPAAFYVVSLLIVMRYPISESKHRAIRAAIDARTRGEESIDPLTAERVAPAEEAAVAARVDWFLDHFSASELARAAERGPGCLRARVLRTCALWLGLFAGSTALAVSRLADWSREPGPMAVLAVVAAGLSLTGFVFHAARIGPARRFGRNPPPAAVLRAHLARRGGHARDGEPLP